MSEIEKIKYFPEAEKNWPTKLLMAGLIIFAIACNFSISLSQIGLGLALIGTIVLLKNKEYTTRPTPIDLSFACFAFAGFLSLFNAAETLKAIIEMKKFLIIFVFYITFWIPYSEAFQKKILGIYLSFATIISAAGIAKLYLVDVNLDRAYGFFSLPITFGECQAMALLLAISWLCTPNKSKNETAGILLSITLILSALILSFTRGAWLGFGFGFLTLLVRFPRKLLMIAVFIGIFVGLLAANDSQVRERFQSMSIKKNLQTFQRRVDAKYETDGFESNFRRLRNWQIGFDIFNSMPVFGAGMNNVKYWYKKRATEFERNNSFIFGHQHNNFMQLMVMTGLLGLTCFFWFLLSLARLLIAAPNYIESDWQKNISKGAIAVLFCFIATGLTEYSWGDEEVAMLAFFLMGIMINPARFNIQKQQQVPAS